MAKETNQSVEPVPSIVPASGDRNGIRADWWNYHNVREPAGLLTERGRVKHREFRAARAMRTVCPKRPARADLSSNRRNGRSRARLGDSFADFSTTPARRGRAR
jgi:hypothetical protein